MRSFLFKTYFLALTTILSIAYLPFLLLPRKYMRLASHSWGRLVFFGLRIIGGVKFRIEGKEHIQEQPILIASQHQSTWETIVMQVLLDRPNFVLKKQLIQIPFFGWYLWKLENISVDRSKGARALKVMLKQAKDRFAKGRSIVIFPHGTRLKAGQSAKIQPGVTAIYKELDKDSNVRVIPVTLNSGTHWPRNGAIKAGEIVMKFHPEIPLGLDKKAFVAKLETILN